MRKLLSVQGLRRLLHIFAKYPPSGILQSGWPELGETHLEMKPKWMWDEYFAKRSKDA